MNIINVYDMKIKNIANGVTGIIIGTDIGVKLAFASIIYDIDVHFIHSILFSLIYFFCIII